MNRTQKTFMPIWQPYTGIPAEAMIGSLSDEEERTVALAARGKGNQEIADYLRISVNTVKFHLSGIYQKVGVTNRRDMKNYLNK